MMELNEKDHEISVLTVKSKVEATSEAAPLIQATDYTLYKWRWVVLGVFSLVSLSNEVIWISLSSITSIVKDYYRVDSIAVNWLSIIFLLLYVFVIAASYILDKYGLKVTIVIGSLLNAFGSCLRAIGSNRDGFVLVFLGNTSAAIAQCFIIFIPPHLASVWFGEKERATASSIGVLMNMLGVAVGFLLAGTMVPSDQDIDNGVQHGMHRLLISQAIFCSLLAIVSLFTVKRGPLTPPSRSQELVLKIKNQAFVKEIISSEKDLLTSSEKGSVEDYVLENGRTVKNQHQFYFEDNVTRKETNKKTDSVSHIPAFGESLLMLAKDKSFHLLSQAFGISGCQIAIYSTLLNQMVVAKYPGKEKEVGYMGFAAGVLGLFGIFFSGIWLDKTRRYKSLSVVICGACSALMLIFTLLLKYHDNFVVLFISFCVFGLFSYAFLFAGLEHVAEITYPIPEGTTSGILFLLVNIYGIIFTNILGVVIRKGSGDVVGYFMAVSYAFCLILVSLNSAPLRRSKADQFNTS